MPAIPNFREIFRQSRTKEEERALTRAALFKLGLFMATAVAMAVARDGVGPSFRVLIKLVRSFSFSLEPFPSA